jgi:quercetin 2,3-dioxygenase
MEIESTHSADAGEGGRSDSEVVETFELGFPWPTTDPFIVTVHHADNFPAGNAGMGPATTDEQREPETDPSSPGWGMYYGRVVPGFPQHPHRGFETVTVVRKGIIDHSDSLGATARYGAGDVQWLLRAAASNTRRCSRYGINTGPTRLSCFRSG